MPSGGSTISTHFLVIGLYFAGLGAFRAAELLSLPGDVVIDPEFPSWLLEYLGALCGVLLAGGLLLLGGGLVARSNVRRGRKLAVAGAATVFLACVAHAVFLAIWERAFAQGGLFPGIKDMLWLTRVYDPSYGNQGAILMYRVGQFAALAAWAGAALYVLGASLLPNDEPRQAA
ncbi:hypothetical protein JY651_08030 [Pyxidicoccus parkwayensis]|uniref:Uncharacterized protein n=1 Tax=Pyxidicoccus parkwayensis TaxID=2813578 RepID=A0ABX7P343_9BACT|nr:hypothetical protein [Pyxidicoccus parkwaysis]QSQ24877.1 hypothetical protein JY651_08030 [Pyxidicoccus parkwaysis]